MMAQLPPPSPILAAWILKILETDTTNLLCNHIPHLPVNLTMVLCLLLLSNDNKTLMWQIGVTLGDLQGIILIAIDKKLWHKYLDCPPPPRALFVLFLVTHRTIFSSLTGNTFF